MLDWLFSLEALEAFLICFSTLMIFSFLYKDNPYYKFAEHVFVGVSTGYGIVLVWFQILRPNLIDRLYPPVDTVKQALFRAGQLSPDDYASHVVGAWERLQHGQFIYYVFLALGILMLFKISRKLHWLSRWPLAYVIGAFAGIQIIQASQGALVPQLEATMKDFSGKEVLVTRLEEFGLLPEGEVAARREAQSRYLQAFLTPLTGEAPAARAAALWQDELEQRLNELAGIEGLEVPGVLPQEAFKAMRVRQVELLESEDEFESLLCSELGGRPLEESLFRAARGLTDSTALPWMNKALREESWRSDPLQPADLPALQLAPWQEALTLLATRIWLESPAGRAELARTLGPLTGLPEAVAVEALVFPEGRRPLVELLKAEVFPADAQPDWSLPRTRLLADSLLNEVNPRPVRVGDWKAEQLTDLLARLGDKPTLRAELEARLALFAARPDSVRQAAGTLFLGLWRQAVLTELAFQRQTWLLQTTSLHTNPDLLTRYSRAQLAAFRADPAGTAAAVGATLSPAKLRLQIMVEVLSNLLVLIGVCTGVFYFFFSKKHTGALGVASKVGIAFLMMSFGASFGYTVMGRISLAIGRFQDLLAWPWMAGTALLVLIAALYLESRRKPA